MELVKREPEVDQLTGNAPRLIRNPNLNHQPEVDQVTENGSADQLTGGESAGWMEVVKGEPEVDQMTGNAPADQLTGGESAGNNSTLGVVGPFFDGVTFDSIMNLWKKFN